jgi:hypothetical protein
VWLSLIGLLTVIHILRHKDDTKQPGEHVRDRRHLRINILLIAAGLLGTSYTYITYATFCQVNIIKFHPFLPVQKHQPNISHKLYTMSNIGQDIKSGLKGIHGAGEALRGSVNEAADQVLDTNAKHPAAQESQIENRGVIEKGKTEVDGADNMIARHEAKHRGTGAPVQSQPIEGNHAFRG